MWKKNNIWRESTIKQTKMQTKCSPMYIRKFLNLQLDLLYVSSFLGFRQVGHRPSHLGRNKGLTAFESIC